MAPGVAAPYMATILDGLIRDYIYMTLDFPFDCALTASNMLGMESQDGRASSNADAGKCRRHHQQLRTEFKGYLLALEKKSSVASFFQDERMVRCLSGHHGQYGGS
jgi:hypothetical protein